MVWLEAALDQLDAIVRDENAKTARSIRREWAAFWAGIIVWFVASIAVTLWLFA